MLRKKIMNMTSANLTNFVFIDPVVRVFEDHCHELKAPEVEELQAFWDWTAELRKFYFESDKEPFNCTDLCKVSKHQALISLMVTYVLIALNK